MKELRYLSEEEFNKLRETGLLKTIYPDAPESYDEIRGKRPAVLSAPKFDKVIALCEAYLDSKEQPEEQRFKAGEHYIFEQALECVYGDDEESGIWAFVNSFEE